MAITIRLIWGVLLSSSATAVFAQSAFPEKPSFGGERIDDGGGYPVVMEVIGVGGWLVVKPNV